VRRSPRDGSTRSARWAHAHQISALASSKERPVASARTRAQLFQVRALPNEPPIAHTSVTTFRAPRGGARKPARSQGAPWNAVCWVGCHGIVRLLHVWPTIGPRLAIIDGIPAQRRVLIPRAGGERGSPGPWTLRYAAKTGATVQPSHQADRAVRLQRKRSGMRPLSRLAAVNYVSR